jgi:GNAT superfamily N-acetyltransferase
MRIIGPQTGLSSSCEAILRALPEWFGIESAIVQYVRDIATLPTFLALDGSDQPIGFMSVKRHFPNAAELHVLAVRNGVGRALLECVEAWLRDEGAAFLQAKTLAPTAAYEPYERTRRFYEAMGFTPLEIFPTLWDVKNPCLMMIKALNGGAAR